MFSWICSEIGIYISMRKQRQTFILELNSELISHPFRNPEGLSIGVTMEELLKPLMLHVSLDIPRIFVEYAKVLTKNKGAIH